MNTSDVQAQKRRYGIVGNFEGLNHAVDVALQVAKTDLSVLITGESGVGKEIIPRIIHDNSLRKTKKYFAVNCGSIPEGTIDSELFGHEKGAFTGAIGEREGYFGAANGGTLFLDEVGELPSATQARLLRVLETGEYIRVGSSDVRKTDVIKDGNEIIGNRTKVKVVKNKLAPPFKVCEFDIIYGKGISREGCILDLALEYGIIQKSGSWFAYNGEKIGQGKENVKQYLADNPAVYEEIEDRIKDELAPKESTQDIVIESENNVEGDA